MSERLGNSEKLEMGQKGLGELREFVRNKVETTEEKIEASLREAEISGVNPEKLSELRTEFKNSGKKLKKFLFYTLLLLFSGFLEDDKIENPSDYLKFSLREEAQKELDRFGITKERKAAMVPIVSDMVYRTVTPFWTNSEAIWYLLKEIPYNLVNDRDVTEISMPNDEDKVIESVEEKLPKGSYARQSAHGIAWEVRKPQIDDTVHSYIKNYHPDREDAWRFYLGLPQQNDTFGISLYQPSRSGEDKYYYKINNWINKFASSLDGYGENDFKPVKAILDLYDKRTFAEENWPAILIDENYPMKDDFEIAVMGTFSLFKGIDEQGTYIAYYDRWDLGDSPEGEKGILGRPFEIYDRIYYDPKTFDIIPD